MSKTDLTVAEIIEKFELQVNDLTELSSDEELDLLNDKAQDVAMERQWEVLKKNATGSLTLDATTGLYYIAKPADFSMFAENHQYTENNMATQNNARPCVVFVGQNRQPFQVINYSDRIQYRTTSSVCYLDLQNNKIYFPVAPSDLTYYDFDYIMVPPLMTLTTDTPSWMPNRFRKMLWFAMATDNEILQLSAKANSYAADNRAKYEDTLEKMNWWNDNQNMN